jgi:hypothetical protein
VVKASASWLGVMLRKLEMHMVDEELFVVVVFGIVL